MNTEQQAVPVAQEPFGYWVEQRLAEPVLLRKPAYIPEPSELRTVTPLYASLPCKSGEGAVERELGAPCENCQKPVEVGQLVVCYDDVGEMHADCDNPFSLEYAPPKDPAPEPVILLGSPMRHVPLALLSTPSEQFAKSSPDAEVREAFSGVMRAEVLDAGAWSLHLHFGRGDGARKRMRAASDLLAAIATSSPDAELRAAVAGIADDYMTSEVHHPGYVLIPTDRFEKLAGLPGARSDGETSSPDAQMWKALSGLELTEDGYSLRVAYDGDAADDGRAIVVGGETVVTFADSDEGEAVREAILKIMGKSS